METNVTMETRRERMLRFSLLSRLSLCVVVTDDASEGQIGGYSLSNHESAWSMTDVMPAK
jgi:hypothetical protein